MVERAGMITNRIKEYRARFDLKQEELARRVGVRRETIGNLEKGRYNPSPFWASLRQSWCWPGTLPRYSAYRLRRSLPWRGMNSIRRSLRGLEHVLE